MTVENIPIPAPAVTATVEERKARAMEIHAEATTKIAQIQLEAGAPFLGDPKMQRFERVLRSCVEGRVATDVEGFLTFARELCDGIDREFPDSTPSPNAP